MNHEVFCIYDITNDFYMKDKLQSWFFARQCCDISYEVKSVIDAGILRPNLQGHIIANAAVWWCECPWCSAHAA